MYGLGGWLDGWRLGEGEYLVKKKKFWIQKGVSSWSTVLFELDTSDVLDQPFIPVAKRILGGHGTIEYCIAPALILNRNGKYGCLGTHGTKLDPLKKALLRPVQ